MKERIIEELTDEALKYLSSEQGKRELEKAAENSREATDNFRRARELDADSLNQRFTV